jgi:hypothetical protein
MHSVRNDSTGVQVLYPGTWEWSESQGESIRLAQKLADATWRRDGGSPPGGLVVYARTFPARKYAAGPWIRGSAEDWSTEDLVRPVGYRRMYDRHSGDFVVAASSLFGQPAVEIRGPRFSGLWGSTLLLLDGEVLHCFDLVAPDRRCFQSFYSTWRRMVRAASRDDR